MIESKQPRPAETAPQDRWNNLHGFLEGTNLSDIERLIVASADDPEAAWLELDLFWSTGICDFTDDSDLN